jgi:trk system potassium uptake protein TrkH
MLLIATSVVGIAPLLADHAVRAPWQPWAWMSGAALAAGLLLLFAGRRSSGSQIGPIEGAAITVGAWLALATAGALGLRLAIPGSNYAACWFEAMSGLTTCGATAFSGIDAMTPGTKLWRALLQWMGGVGIIGLGLVLLPMLRGGSSFQLFRAESSGLALDRLTPRLADTVRQILLYNLILNLGAAIALHATGLPWLDSVCYALAAISTGGYGTTDAGIASFANPAAEWVLVGAMIVAGVNFALVVTALRGQPVALWRSEEVRAYLLASLLATAAVACILVAQRGIYSADGHALVRHAAFAVVSLGTSTGFTVGFEHHPQGWGGWPPAAIAILMICTRGLGCTGSTVGGAKMLRLLILAKLARLTMRRFAEPATAAVATIDRRPIDQRAAQAAMAWVVCFAVSLAGGTVALLLLAPGLDLPSAASAVYVSLTNAGPGIGLFGPDRSYAAAGDAGLVLLALVMLVGRLEFLAVLVVLAPSAWRR